MFYCFIFSYYKMNKKTVIILLVVWFALYCSGCLKQNIELQPVAVIENTGNITNENKNITIHWNTLSWINISGNNIYISGDKLIYNNIFSMKLSEKWLSQREFYNIYGDTFNMSDWNFNSIQINKYTLSQNNKCDYNFDEWVKKISKSIKIINWVKVNIAMALFSISWPDIKNPINSWQSFMCFEEWENIYRVIVYDDSQFRTDIINSFKFLK